MARVRRKLVAVLHMRRTKRDGRRQWSMTAGRVVACGQRSGRSMMGGAKKPPKSPKPAISDEHEFGRGVPMKVVLFVLFALAAITGTAALFSVPMQALANDEVAPVRD
jgi:hypothetical protein